MYGRKWVELIFIGSKKVNLNGTCMSGNIDIFIPMESLQG